MSPKGSKSEVTKLSAFVKMVEKHRGVPQISHAMRFAKVKTERENRDIWASMQFTKKIDIPFLFALIIYGLEEMVD